MPQADDMARGRLQRDRLCQSDERPDAEQVGQHQRLLGQELVEGWHTYSNRSGGIG